MAKFLNRQGILKHFERLFVEAKKEIVMIVPFIKTDENILNNFQLAEKKGVEVLIVFKENEVHKSEIDKLKKFNNVTLLHHPNVHAKCYMNDFSLIVCSMNLYEHSMKNNREMGVLLDFFSDEIEGEEIGDIFFDNDDEAIEEAREEVNEIIKSSTIVHKSKKISESGFSYDILKSLSKRLGEYATRINELSDNKNFSVVKSDQGFELICQNYADHIDLVLDVDENIERDNMHALSLRRVEIRLRHPQNQIKQIKASFQTGKKLEFRYKYYKVYWSYGKSIFVYRNQVEFPEIWKIASSSEEFKGLIKGSNIVISDLKKIREFNKIF